MLLIKSICCDSKSSTPKNLAAGGGGAGVVVGVVGGGVTPGGVVFLLAIVDSNSLFIAFNSLDLIGRIEERATILVCSTLISWLHGPLRD
jgi:hypothetical protein